jgi:RNA polymerase sigma factor FliA
MTDTPLPLLWDAYWRDRDSEEALAALVEAWLPLAQRVLERFAIRLPTHVQRDDLFQCAAMGLCQAVETFSPDAQVAFEAYATRRIRGAMIDELRHNDHLTRGARHKLRKLEKAAEQWTQAHGRPPSEEELARETAMTSAALAEILGQAQPWLSLDQPWTNGAHGAVARLQDILCDDKTLAPDQQAVRRELYASFRAAFRKLATREQKILYLYYFEELRLSEIAALFSLTEARISQIQSMAVLKLRAMMQGSKTTGAKREKRNGPP